MSCMHNNSHKKGKNITCTSTWRIVSLYPLSYVEQSAKDTCGTGTALYTHYKKSNQKINDRSALQSVFSSIIWPPLASSENLSLLHVNDESISLSEIYQQYQIHVRENRGDHYEWAIKRHWQLWLHKIQGEDKQNKDTGNHDYTRYRVKINKTKTLATLITQDTGWRQTKQRHWQPSCVIKVASIFALFVFTLYLV
jgi:hypothetical protein